MDVVLWGISALRFYRIPPFLQRDLALWLDWRRLLARRGEMTDLEASGWLGHPVHVLVFERSGRRALKNVKQHLSCRELPEGALIECGPYLKVASPQLALMEVAPYLTDVQLCMLVHEVCGGFATPALPSSCLEELQGWVDRGWRGAEGWSPSLDGRDGLTELWQRPPLVDIAELRKFARSSKGMRGSVRLAWAAEHFFGEARSPFEVRAALQYGLPRLLGGEGRSVRLNERIAMTRGARILGGRRVCFADLLLESKDSGTSLIIECQSRLVHADADHELSDFDRQVALSSMGYEVIPLTYAQLRDDLKHRRVAELVGMKLEGSYRQKTPLLLERERSLRRELFANWSDLGM